MTTDTERLDWLESQPGAVLASTDEGQWAVTDDVVDNGNDAVVFQGVIEPNQLQPTVRAAIDAAMQLAAPKPEDESPVKPKDD